MQLEFLQRYCVCACLCKYIIELAFSLLYTFESADSFTMPHYHRYQRETPGKGVSVQAMRLRVNDKGCYPKPPTSPRRRQLHL